MVNGEYKNIMKRIMMIIMAVALIVLPTMAQQQQWQSTSTMQGTGSTLAPQVTAVGATTVGEMATTTGSAKAPGGPRRSFDGGTYEGGGTNPGELGHQDSGSPIGDALIPLLVMSLAFGGYVAIRRKRLAEQASR